jgi:lipid-A-disaccharide synthase
MTAAGGAALRIFLVAVEESGDQLGAALMRALRQRRGVGVEFAGVGGTRMAAEGLDSLHSTDDFSIMGVAQIPRRAPALIGHLRRTLSAIRAWRPDVLVVIDSPGYSMWVAAYAKRANPALKIVDYVSPSVWAWRPSRAAKMRAYIDHILALLPFEPEVHRKLGGPPCTYVGHPIVEQVSRFRPNADEAKRRDSAPPVIVVLPGSRSGEIARMAADFGAALSLIHDRIGPIEAVVPTVPHHLERIKSATASWPVTPRIVTEHSDKQAAFRTARAALAKSGTVTLELALAGVPMVVAYKVSAIDAVIMRRVIKAPTVVLANLVIGENIIPELLQEDCTPQRLAEAMLAVIADSPERRRQLDAFARLDAIMEIGAASPALRAADIVLDHAPQ